MVLTIPAQNEDSSRKSDKLEDKVRLAKLYYEKCEFLEAHSEFHACLKWGLEHSESSVVLESISYLLRIAAEREDASGLIALKQKLTELVTLEKYQLNSRIHYVLGICAAYQREFQLALEHFQRALTIGLAQDNKTDICFAINGLAITYFSLDRLSEALKEIYNMQVFFEVLDLPDLKLSSRILNGNILRKMRKYDQALEIFWDCFDYVRSEKNLYMYLQLLYFTAATYRDSGERELARLYFHLAKKTIDPKSLVYLNRHIDNQLAELGMKQSHDFDIVFDSASHSITERKKGRVDFKNQFILLDMLRLFMRSPGQVFSKEELVKEVWKQAYDPAVHDNKIYVTIKRLRKMIEPDFDRPRYLFRAKNGYYLNKAAKVRLDQ